MSTENNLEPEIVPAQYSEKEIVNRKTAACAVSLGAAIIQEMIGTSIGKPLIEQDLNELVASGILAELTV